jgi:vacuolar protein sorting-associated protein 16
MPPAYTSVFESFSEEPGALLRAAYAAFEDEEPLQDDQIRKDKDKLSKAVEQCLASARFELNFEKISELMKAATYGKAFLPPNLVNNNDIYETSKLLRICHMLRERLRFITFEQLRLMGDDQLLKMLLRYQEHYLAFEVYGYLKKDQNFRVKIYTDWACCRVQNHEQSEDEICESIRQKLEKEKGVSFTEIAHRSIEIGRSELAMKLLEYEPSLSKKVPLLLWIGNRENL